MVHRMVDENNVGVVTMKAGGTCNNNIRLLYTGHLAHSANTDEGHPPFVYKARVYHFGFYLAVPSRYLHVIIIRRSVIPEIDSVLQTANNRASISSATCQCTTWPRLTSLLKKI